MVDIKELAIEALKNKILDKKSSYDYESDRALEKKRRYRQSAYDYDDDYITDEYEYERVSRERINRQNLNLPCKEDTGDAILRALSRCKGMGLPNLSFPGDLFDFPGISLPGGGFDMNINFDFMEGLFDSFGEFNLPSFDLPDFGDFDLGLPEMDLSLMFADLGKSLGNFGDLMSGLDGLFDELSCLGGAGVSDWLDDIFDDINGRNDEMCLDEYGYYDEDRMINCTNTNSRLGRNLKRSSKYYRDNVDDCDRDLREMENSRYYDDYDYVEDSQYVRNKRMYPQTPSLKSPPAFSMQSDPFKYPTPIEDKVSYLSPSIPKTLKYGVGGIF